MKNLILAALCAIFITPAFANDSKPNAPKPATIKSLPAGVKSTTLSAPKMHCAGCAMGIKVTLSKLKGVKTVEANPEKKLVVVTYVAAIQNPKLLAAALTKAGWPATVVKPAA